MFSFHHQDNNTSLFLTRHKARICYFDKKILSIIILILTKDTILDADKLSELFDRDKFIVKITPIHETNSAVNNGFDVTTSYEDYNVYRDFERPLLDKGWDVIVFVPSKEEDSDRITCGNALISNKKGDK